MDSGSTFPRFPEESMSRVSAAATGAAYGWLRCCRQLQHGRDPSGSRTQRTAVPRKACGGPHAGPYQNRHRWEGALTHQGAREKPR